MFLKEYYRVKTDKQAYISFLGDICISIFLFSGTGLISSLLKGLVAHIFISSGFPTLIGRRFRVRHPSNITIGNHVSIKDDVSILADAPIRIGNNSIIAEKTILSSYGPGLYIGSNTVIGNGCYIAQNGGKITIGDNVLIADGVRIYSLNHKFASRKIPIKNQGVENCTIEIQDNVWIGAGVVIFNNTTIGSGSVIGANSVVRKSVPKNVVYAGNPGKIIKELK